MIYKKEWTRKEVNTLKIKKEIKEIQKNSQNLSAILEVASFLLDSGETLNANKKFNDAIKNCIKLTD